MAKLSGRRGPTITVLPSVGRQDPKVAARYLAPVIIGLMKKRGMLKRGGVKAQKSDRTVESSGAEKRHGPRRDKTGPEGDKQKIDDSESLLVAEAGGDEEETSPLSLTVWL